MVQLKYVVFHLTYVCENKCPYCYVGDEGRNEHPPFEKVKKVIERLAKDRIEEVTNKDHECDILCPFCK